MAVTAIVPLKALSLAKGRLAGHLDAEERRAIVTWMLDRVLGACLSGASIDRVLVVAGDHQAAAAAARPGVDVLVEPSPGLTAALDAADDAARGAAATLVVVADLPLATAADLDAVCSTDAAVVVAPTRDGGTGALLRRPAGVIRTAFGAGSAAAHVRLAEAAGVHAARLDLPNLALDVDTPGELRSVSASLAAASARRAHHAQAYP